MKPLQGTAVTIDASGSFDPDGNTLSFKWWTMPKAGTYTGAILLTNANANRLTVNVPSNAAGKTFHVICEVYSAIPQYPGIKSCGVPLAVSC
jgi:hypothetical protein